MQQTTFRGARRAALVAALICAGCGDGAGRAAAAGRSEDHVAEAVAAIEQGRHDDAWRHARKAVRASSSDPRASEIFNALWLAFDRQGIMNAGGTEADVVAGLGRPDGRHVMAGVLRLEYGYMAVELRGGKTHATVDLRGLGDEAVRAREEIRLQRDGRSWRVGHRQITGTQVNTEYVLPDQTVQQWQELLSVQRIVGLAERGVPLAPFAAGMRSAFHEQSPEGSWQTVEKTESEIVYEFVVPPGARNPEQHEVGRIVLGDHDIHRVAYVRKGSPLNALERDRWLRLLRRSPLRRVRASTDRQDRRPSGPQSLGPSVPKSLPLPYHRSFTTQTGA